jgi:protein-S-isoprenylcysteine O-methyltransferase Ste14
MMLDSWYAFPVMRWDTVDLALWIVFFVVWVAAAPFSRKTVRKEPIAARMRYAFFGVIAAALINPRLPVPWLDGFDPRTSVRAGLWGDVPPWLGLLSVALTAAGVTFAFWARFTLGRNWSGTVTLKEDHTLVQTGPYALARHPIYTGLVVAFIGTFLGVGVGLPRILLGVAAIVVGLSLKMRTEERFMLEHFGDAYADYRRRVRGLIPFVF